MDLQDGFDLTELISDKFTINSAGKTPQSRKSESFSKNFSSKMTPCTLVFEDYNSYYSSSGWESATELKGKSPLKMEEETSFLCAGEMTRKNSPLKSIENTICNSPFLEKNNFIMSRRSDVLKLESPKCNKGKENISPIVKDNLMGDNGKTPSKFSVVKNSLRYSPKCKSRLDSILLQDAASRDSGFENSTSFADSDMKTVPDYSDFLNLSNRFGSRRRFESDFREPSTSHSPPDLDTLQDLELELDLAYQSSEPSCSKYEIISTDSPDISGKVGTIIAHDFQFGSPIGDCETSENFNVTPKVTRKLPIRSETTRMLNFDEDTETVASFKFTPPTTLPPKRSDLISPCKIRSPFQNYFAMKSKINNSPSPVRARKIGEKSPHVESGLFKAKKMRVDSGIEGDISSPYESPLKHLEDNDNWRGAFAMKKNKFNKSSGLFNCMTSSSIESGCITEMDECMSDVEELCPESDDDIPIVPSSLHALILGEIKSGIKTTPNRTDDKVKEEKTNVNERPSYRRCLSLQTEEGVERVRAALFRSPGKARKRTETESSSVALPKRRKSQILRNLGQPFNSRPVLQRTISDNEATIKMSLAKAYNDPNIIGDHSRPFCLPLEESQHQDLKAISGDTLTALIQGEFKDKVDSFQVIDCRYPYEFEGGHIVGAQNLFTEELVNERLLSPFCNTPIPSSARNIIIFHCEFSSERGPNLCRFLRQADRHLNRDSYPSLLYPELYILQGGYREFHANHGQHCRPVAGGYVPMRDPQYSNDLKHYRAANSRHVL